RRPKVPRPKRSLPRFGALGGALRRGAQDLVASLPVARAQLVRLQRVENAQRLGRVAADIEAVHRDMLDDIVGIDDEGRAEGDALAGIENAERARELLLVVGDPREVR